MEQGIRFDDVTFGYPDKPNILSHVNMVIPRGTFLGITGVNGSGKSTMTYCMNGLIPHSIQGKLTGNVAVDGIQIRTKSVSYFSHSVGMVFQNPDFSLFNLTVSEEIGFGLKNLTGHVHQSQIEKVLHSVGLIGYEQRDPQTLSFGEKQKVCLACVLALDVSYIILDEPTAMLDWKSSVELYELLKSLNKEGKTIITVEHDTDFLWEYTHHVVILDKGSIKATGATRKILSDHKLLESLGIKKPHSVLT
jgi:energy-coupling factor transporter ATP-binding protein EcfA2